MYSLQAKHSFAKQKQNIYCTNINADITYKRYANTDLTGSQAGATATSCFFPRLFGLPTAENKQ